jgi:hypothetical protein
MPSEEETSNARLPRRRSDLTDARRRFFPAAEATVPCLPNARATEATFAPQHLLPGPKLRVSMKRVVRR